MAQFLFRKTVACLLRPPSHNLYKIERAFWALEGGQRFLQTSSETKSVRRFRLKATLLVGKEAIT